MHHRGQGLFFVGAALSIWIPFRAEAAGGLAQPLYVKPLNAQAGDRFGHSIAVSGDTIVIGAPLEDGEATGVNGDSSTNSASSSGAAYVFVKNGETFVQQAYLKPSNTDVGDTFGWSVAISGDTVVVGAFGEDSKASGVDGQGMDDSSGGSGAAYVFVRTSGVWAQQAYLKASNTGAGDAFGHSVAIDGDVVVVGARHEDGGAAAVAGDPEANDASSAGAAYVFERSGIRWAQQAVLKAPNAGAGDEFGFSVAVAGDTIVVGAPKEDSNAIGVDGDPDDEGSMESGAAYVFVRHGSKWQRQAYLKPQPTYLYATTQAHFGRAVAISGDTIVVGAPVKSGSYHGGFANVFVRIGSTWTRQALLTSSDGATDGEFGAAVAIDGDRIVVGAHRENDGGPGVHPDPSIYLVQSGSAYLFERQASTWVVEAQLKASNPGIFDHFGGTIAIADDLVVLGARDEDGAGTVVGGDGGNDAALDAGAGYVFTLPCGSIEVVQPQCSPGLPNGPSLVVTGCAAAGSVLEVKVGSGEGGAAFAVFAGSPSGGCPLFVATPLTLLLASTLGGSSWPDGHFAFSAPIPASFPPQKIAIQAAMAATAAPNGFGLSNAVFVDID
jgi:hypothetical protein